MRLSVKATAPELSAEYPPKVRKALAVALTRTAWEVRADLTTGMQQAFERPTPFTMRAFRVDGATAAGLEATVYAAPLQARYLFWEVEGGTRVSKGFEKHMGLSGGQAAIPGDNASRNAYGNMPLGFIRRVTGDSKRYFVGTPKQGGAAGVWMRSGNSLRPMMLFADSATYAPRFDVHGIAVRTVETRFPSQIMRALSA